MSERLTLNRVRRAFYLDSVALMRLSQTISALPGVEAAALMIGSPSNKQIMADAGLLADEGREATPNDLIVALRATDHEAGEAALGQAEALLDRPTARTAGGAVWQPKTLDAAADALPGANLAVVSVPGEFAASEAHKALRAGLHVMIFSDNVAIDDECALKREARQRGLLLMGPDCGTALIGGVPLAFANEVPRGDIGIVAASGTGLQEVSCLIARAGKGVSHGIGVGGRDLGETVGGAMTLAAIDALDADPETDRIVLISKPPAAAVARKVLKRVGESAKPFTICFAGLDDIVLPANARLAPTLRAAAEDAVGGASIAIPGDVGDAAARAAASLGAERRWIRGLYTGGTLCAEAQIVLRAAGEEVCSNAPVPGARPLANGAEPVHSILDLGADGYTVGRPHPMIDPTIRGERLIKVLAEPDVAVILLDVVIGYGAHDDPAGAVVASIAGATPDGPAIVASVCGTEGDPQVYSAQVRTLAGAGVIVAPSNAQAAEIALQISRRST